MENMTLLDGVPRSGVINHESKVSVNNLFKLNNSEHNFLVCFSKQKYFFILSLEIKVK